MEEEFYATIKLTSGEELLAKVCYDPSDDVIVALQPLLVEKVTVNENNLVMEGFDLRTWISSSTDDMFIIPRNQIITMTECNDSIQKHYEEALENIIDNKLPDYQSVDKPQRRSGNRQSPRDQDGFLGKTREARISLEDIFKRS